MKRPSWSERKNMLEGPDRDQNSGGAGTSTAEEDGLPPRVAAAARRRSLAGRSGAQPAFKKWPTIRSELRAAKRWAFFLDFDGTLVQLRRRPGDVSTPQAARAVLKRLAARDNVSVTIVSGRRLRDVRELVALDEVRYVGVHGGEREEGRVVLADESRAALDDARHSVCRLLGGAPGIWIEDKGISIAVHYRAAPSRGPESAGQTLAQLAQRWGDALHILNGIRVWEILPREIPGKFKAVEESLSSNGLDTAAIYAGNDGTDEPAFAALRNQITIRVGYDQSTSARFFVRTPAETLRLLGRMEKELQ
jgi:trehalose 6-phosphate phosphatase